MGFGIDVTLAGLSLVIAALLFWTKCCCQGHVTRNPELAKAVVTSEGASNGLDAEKANMNTHRDVTQTPGTERNNIPEPATERGTHMVATQKERLPKTQEPEEEDKIQRRIS